MSTITTKCLAIGSNPGSGNISLLSPLINTKYYIHNISFYCVSPSYIVLQRFVAGSFYQLVQFDLNPSIYYSIPAGGWIISNPEALYCYFSNPAMNAVYYCIDGSLETL